MPVLLFTDRGQFGHQNFKKFWAWQLPVQPLHPKAVDFKDIGPSTENVEITHDPCWPAN
jgi:hypothetical protein